MFPVVRPDLVMTDNGYERLSSDDLLLNISPARRCGRTMLFSKK